MQMRFLLIQIFILKSQGVLKGVIDYDLTFLALVMSNVDV